MNKSDDKKRQDRNNPGIENSTIEFSVVMAVYNVEHFLRQAVDSLIGQTFGFENIQLIMVDDGSTDASPAICDEYAKNYPDNIMVIHKKNGGVASARNEGLKYATGRYLNFMDSDDYFTDNVFEKVFEFFKEHSEEVDIATVPLKFFDAQKGEHWQNEKFKKGTRIIDLYNEYQSPLMFVNASFFSSKLKNRIEFDDHLVCGEDIKVILTLLVDKMKLGVINGCNYMYRRRSVGESSLIQSSKKKKGWYFDYFTYLIDWCVQYYKGLLGYLPAFVQYELLSDIQWRYREIYDMSEVLSEKEAVLYKERLAETLKYFDDRYILEMKMVYSEHKSYMLSQKYGHKPTLTKYSNDVLIHYGNTILSRISEQLCMIEFVRIEKSQIIIEGYTKLLGISEDEPVKVYLKVNDQLYLCDIQKREEINDYRFGDLICRGIQFKQSIPLEIAYKKYEINLVICYQDVYVTKRNIRCGKFVPITQIYKKSYFYNNGWALQCIGNTFVLEQCDVKKHRSLERAFLKELWAKKTRSTQKAVLVRIFYYIVSKLSLKEIWLISDRIMEAGDNGEAFFKYLVKQKNNHIRPYFVIHKESSDFERLKKIGRVIPYHSWKHKLLHLMSKKIISSHADTCMMNPFFDYEMNYRDLIQQHKFIFLQHGITMNDVSKVYSRYRVNATGFLSSALPEYKSLLDEKYGYNEQNIWLTGFPRYDYLKNAEKKKVVIMPTWRAYLVSDDPLSGGRILKDGFETSEYFFAYFKLLNDKLLGETAKSLGYELHFISHPNMRASLKLLTSSNGTIIHDKKIEYSHIFAEGSLLVTDYSSTAFDFAYLKKPIVYCHIDANEFFSGKHTVKPDYFDYGRDGFGEVEYTLEETVNRIIEYMKNDCKLKDKYRQRIDNFFAYDDKNNCQRVYEKIMELDKTAM